MTRINCRPVAGIHTKQLSGEYVEILRPFALMLHNVRVGNLPKAIPNKYRLGPGHVIFFYDKLGYLDKRYAEIADELEKRGFKLNRRNLRKDFAEIPDRWWGDWEPDELAQLINEARIQSALAEMRERGTA